MNIHVHIDRLILDGVATAEADGRLIHAAVEQELAALFATEGLPTRWHTGGAFPSLVGTPLLSPASTTAGRQSATGFGRGIAQSVHGGFGP